MKILQIQEINILKDYTNWLSNFSENLIIFQNNNKFWFLGIIIILMFLIIKYTKNCHNYIMSLIFLKLNDNPRSYARKKKFSIEELEDIQNQVNWKPPINYPPKLKKNYFELTPEKLNLNKNEILDQFTTYILSGADYNTLQRRLKILKIEDFRAYRSKYPKYKSLFNRPMEHNYQPPDDDRTPSHHSTEDYLSWNLDWDQVSIVWDHYIFSIPIVMIFLFIHWIIAETLLTKFKCQQHYLLNKWVFGIGSIVLYYIYCHFTHLRYDYLLNPWILDGEYIPYVYNFGISEWPVYMVLYDWWFYLIVYSIIVIFFFFLGPKTIYLRDNDNLNRTNYVLNFIFVFIGLLLPPIFAQKELPFWEIIENTLFTTTNNELHYGITYLLTIILIIAFTSILWFYFLVIIPNVFKAILFKDNSYYKDIEWILFSGESDESDWNKAENIPNSLKNPFFARNTLNLRVIGENNFRPEGFHYKKFQKGNTIIEKYLWTGSYSKWILLSWYFSISFYCLILKWLFFYITWSSLLYLTLGIFLILNFIYIIFVIKVLGQNIIIKKKFKIMFIIYIVNILLLLYWFWYDFIYILKFFITT